MLIGEVAQHSGVSARMLRHYDRIGLLRPSERTGAGYREYSDADVEKLLHIEGLRTLGLSLGQITDVLADDHFAPSALIAQLVERTREQIAQATELVTRLESVRTADPQTWGDVLRTVDLLRELHGPTPSGRQRLALSLTDIDERDVATVVASLLNEESEDAAGALQWTIARAGDAAVPMLVDAVTADDALHRRRALDALEKIGSPAAIHAIAEMTETGDPRMHVRAVLARAREARPDAVAELVDLIRAGRNDVDAADALRDLVAAHDLETEASAAVASALVDADAAARRRLAAALWEIPGEVSSSILTGLLTDEDRGTALTAQALLTARGLARDGAE